VIRVLRERWGLWLDLIRWNRPAGWLLLLWPSLSALWIASHGWPGWHLLAVFVLGTILMRSAGCCVNDVADRDFDKHVKRTAQRPVTAGKVSVKEALALGAVLALLAFGLVLTTNAVTIAWSFAALAIAIAYPYAKRFVSDAAGGAGRGIQLWHPDGLRRSAITGASGGVGAAGGQPVLGAGL
jgi:4-hydroxybenzoate polyprenyltransferase